jgi:hypothetical protein
MAGGVTFTFVLRQVTCAAFAILSTHPASEAGFLAFRRGPEGPLWVVNLACLVCLTLPRLAVLAGGFAFALPRLAPRFRRTAQSDGVSTV